MKADTKFLIVLTGSLGDVVRACAVATRLKANLDGCKIGWLIEKRWQDIVANHPAVDFVHIFDRHHPVRSIISLSSDLRANSYDICLDLQRIFRSGLLSRVCGAKRRIGFHRKDSKEFNWLFNSEHIEKFGEKVPKINNYLAFVDYLGVGGEGVDFGLRTVDLTAHLPDQLRNRGNEHVVFVMGSSWQSKNWLASGYVDVIGQVLMTTNFDVVLVGDGAHQPMAHEVSAALNSTRVFNLTGKTSLLELCAALRYARAGVGPDSGPAHVASAFAVPYVTLFGPTLADRVAPHGNEDLQVRSALACCPCYRRHCPGLDRLCMRLISPQAVLERFQQALARRAA